MRAILATRRLLPHRTVGCRRSLDIMNRIEMKLSPLPADQQPKPNALKPNGAVAARLATAAELKASKARLFVAADVAGLYSLGFVHVFRAPQDEAEATTITLQLRVASEDACSRLVWIHTALGKPALKARRRVRQACKMLTEVRLACWNLSQQHACARPKRCEPH